MNDSEVPKAFVTRAVRPHELLEDEIDIRELMGILWAGRWVILFATVLFGSGAAIYAFSQPDLYRSEVLLAPNIDESGNSLSRLAGQFGGLASLAGVDLGSSGGGKKTIALEVLKSRAFLTQFIRNRQLEVPLLATTGWDLKNNGWRLDPEVYDISVNAWKPDREGKPGEPTDWDLFKVFSREILRVSEDKGSGFVRVSAQTRSPEASMQWVTWLVLDLNAHMRQVDIAEAEQSISYLRSQLQTTSLAEMRQIFFHLIEQQTRTIMLANVRPEYVFKTVDPAIVPEEKSGPKRALTLALGCMLGGVIGLLFVFFRKFLASGRA